MKPNGAVKSIAYTSAGATVVVHYDEPAPAGEDVPYDLPPAWALRAFERAFEHEPPFKVDVTTTEDGVVGVKVHR